MNLTAGCAESYLLHPDYYQLLLQLINVVAGGIQIDMLPLFYTISQCFSFSFLFSVYRSWISTGKIIK